MRYDRAHDFKAERVERGAFRCDRCQSLWPRPPIVQDGLTLCERDADRVPKSVQRDLANYAEGALPIYVSTRNDERNPDPPVSHFTGVSSVTAISPTTLNLAINGASGQIILTGVNLSSSNSITSNGAQIDVSATVDSTTQITLTITAGFGATRGDYNLLFDGSTLTPRGILKVR